MNSENHRGLNYTRHIFHKSKIREQKISCNFLIF